MLAENLNWVVWGLPIQIDSPTLESRLHASYFMVTFMMLMLMLMLLPRARYFKPYVLTILQADSKSKINSPSQRTGIQTQTGRYTIRVVQPSFDLVVGLHNVEMLKR